MTDRTPQDDADVIREALFWIERGNEGSFHYERGIEALDRLLALLAEKDTQIEETERENTALRGIASKIMPCHFCGAEEIAMCPKGFPGCALMDDVMGMEEGVMIELREARAEIERLRPFAAEMSGLINDMGDVPNPYPDDLHIMARAIRGRVERDAAQVRTLTEALVKFGRHGAQCHGYRKIGTMPDGSSWRCTCGLLDALAFVQQPPAEEQT